MHRNMTNTKDQIQDQRREINDLKKKSNKMKIELKSKTHDLDESKVDIQNKERNLSDIKETLSRQNFQIEKMRDEMAEIQRSESFLKSKTKHQEALIENIKNNKEKKEAKKDANEQNIYQLTV